MITDSLGPIKDAAISTAATTDLVALVAGKRIRVLALELTNATAGTIRFQSNAASDLTGVMNLGINGHFVLPFNGAGWFQTFPGEKLTMVLASTGQVSGSLKYQEVADTVTPAYIIDSSTISASIVETTWSASVDPTHWTAGNFKSPAQGRTALSFSAVSAATVQITFDGAVSAGDSITHNGADAGILSPDFSIVH
jgi:hypothetical protein